MYYIFEWGNVYHVIEEPRWQDAKFTECGLVCTGGDEFSKRPSFLELCKNCAKHISSKGKSDA